MKSKSLVLSLSLALSAAFSASADNIPEEYRSGGLAIGCQAYSFNRYTVREAIEKTAEAGGRVIEFYPGQSLSPEHRDMKWDHNASDETMDTVKGWLAEHHIKAVNYGVVGIPKDEAEARKIFVFARKLGLWAVTTESVDAIDTIEKMVREYDIRVGFHDHPRRENNPGYRMWDPNYVLSVVKDRDSRIGSCADTGHWVRSGLNPVECLRILRGRIISSHLKDLNEFGKLDAHDLPYGTGVSDVPAILTELKTQGFKGNISVEYEYHWESSVPEIAQCIGFVRGFGEARDW